MMTENSMCIKKSYRPLIIGRMPWQPDGIKFTQCVSDQKSAFSPL